MLGKTTGEIQEPHTRWEPKPSPPIVYDRAQIEAMIPQSGNFLFPGSVEVAADGKSAIGRMQVPNEGFIRDGHFGVLPGVLQVEFGQQVGAVLLGHTNPELGGVARNIQNVQIDTIAKIGEVLIATVTLVRENISLAGRGTAQLSVEIRKENAPEGARPTTFSFSPEVMPRMLLEQLIGLNNPSAGQERRQLSSSPISSDSKRLGY